MQLLNNYKQSLQAIYDYFGFKEDWTVFPIDDRTKYYWELDSENVTYYDSREAFEEEAAAHAYEDEILRHRFYEKTVYKGEDYTMIIVDTHTDGNRFFAIYDNSKKI